MVDNTIDNKGEIDIMKLVKIQEYDIGQKIEIFQSPETKGLYFDTGNTGKVIPLRPNDVAIISSSINTETMLTNSRAKASAEAYNDRLALLAKYQETIAALKLVVNKMYKQTLREGEEVEREVLWEEKTKTADKAETASVSTNGRAIDAQPVKELLTGGTIKNCSGSENISVDPSRIEPIKF